MANRTLRVLNSGGNVEYERDLGPYENVVLSQDGESVVVQCSPLVTEQQVAESAVPQAVLGLVPEAQTITVEVPIAVQAVERFSGEGSQPYRFRVKASNGEVLAQSEGYSRAKDRDKTADTFAQVFGVSATEAEEG